MTRTNQINIWSYETRRSNTSCTRAAIQYIFLTSSIVVRIDTYFFNRSILILSSNLRLRLPFLWVCLLKFSKYSYLLPFWLLLNLLDLVTLTILGKSTNYEVPHCGALSTPHSHPSWAQMFTSE